MTADRLRVFISSDIVEFRTLRLWLARELNLEVLEPVLFELKGAKPDSPIKESLRLARESDIYLGIFGRDYSDVTIQEFNEAYHAGIPCYIYIANLLGRDPKLDAFLNEEVSKKVIYHQWASETDLIQTVKSDLLEHITTLARTGLSIKKPIQQMTTTERGTAPTITAIPPTGEVGSDIFISGTGFQPQEQLELFIGQEKLEPKLFWSSDGGYVTWVRTPFMRCGFYELKVQNRNGKSAKTFFSILPLINLKPSVAVKGATSVLSGSGFDAESPITIRFDGAVLPLKEPILTTKRGELSARITIPREIIPGRHTILVSDRQHTTATATFTLVAPVISVSPTASCTDANLVLTGTSFNPESMLQISISDRKISIPLIRTTVEGTFTVVITIHKGLPHGNHIIRVSDENGNTALATFEVVA